MDFNYFSDKIPKIKNIPLPAQESQFKMSPPFRRELIDQYRERMLHAKNAAVMALFYPDQNSKARLALILRNTYKGVHSAQVGFPGGKIEPNDDNLMITALRETEEEIGVPKQKIEVIQKLTELYIPPSNFNVQPFMGLSRETPKFIKQDDEVREILEIFVDQLLDDELVVNEKVPTSLNKELEVPAFQLNGHTVWGATAMMLSEIKDLLKEVL